MDETGIDAFLYRQYGYAPKGTKVFGKITGRKFQRTGIVAGLSDGKAFAPFEYPGTMDSALFEMWFCDYLLPSLPPKTAIVMDNAAFHRKKPLAAAAKERGCRLVFLPPYSPELNPIEKFWGWMKRTLRNILPSFNSLSDAISYAFQVC